MILVEFLDDFPQAVPSKQHDQGAEEGVIVGLQLARGGERRRVTGGATQHYLGLFKPESPLRQFRQTRATSPPVTYGNGL